MIAEQLADYLSQTYSSVFENYQPDTPDSVIVVNDESAPIEAVSQNYGVDNFGAQVIIRESDQRTARNKANAIYADLVGKYNYTLSEGGYLIQMTTVSTMPSPIGMDDKNRHEFTVHFIFRVTNKTPERTY